MASLACYIINLNCLNVEPKLAYPEIDKMHSQENPSLNKCLLGRLQFPPSMIYFRMSGWVILD